MKINDAEWTSLRRAVEHDDRETFERLVQTFADKVVYHEKARKRAADQVRARERGERPYLCLDR